MFVLPTARFPDSPPALADAITRGLAPYFPSGSPDVRVEGDQISSLRKVSADVTGARIDRKTKPVAAGGGAGIPAFTTQELKIVGRSISVFDANVNFSLEASDAEIHQSARGDELLLFPARVRSGRLMLDALRSDLEFLAKKAAMREAEKQGVKVEDLKLALEVKSARELSCLVTVTVKKLILKATLRISGELSLNDTMEATLCNLRCEGDGGMANLASAALAPYLAKLEGRAFPLTALPLGKIKLHDVAFAADGDRVSVRGEFA